MAVRKVKDDILDILSGSGAHKDRYILNLGTIADNVNGAGAEACDDKYARENGVHVEVVKGEQ